MKRLSLFFQYALVGIMLLATSALPAQAQKPVSAAQQLVSAEPWLSKASQTRLDILTELASKAGQPPYDKALPLLQKAQAELAQTDPKSRSAAVDDAYDAALLVITQTQDHALAARLFDGFLLPALRFASPDPGRYDGRLHLLKTAVSVYGQAGLPDRQLAALRLLRQEAGDNENLQDWVNLQFSAIYAQRGQYGPAADALTAVQTPAMMGPVSSFETLEQKSEEQKQEQEQQAASAKTRSAKLAHAKAVPGKPVRKKRLVRR